MTTWVLLRGLMRDRRHWGAFLPAFAARVAPTPVIAIDFPGNGERHRQASLPTIAATTDFVRAELARLHVSEPVSVLAMSMGAMVTADWAQRYPQDIERALLVNTSLRPFSPFYHRLRPHNYGALLRLVLWPRAPEVMEQQVLAMTSNLAAERAPVLAHWAAVRQQRPVSALNALRQLLAAARYRAPAQAPRPPLLLLASGDDPLVSSACSQALAAAWNLPLVMHPFAGHDLPLDDPAWVVAQVRQWATRPPLPSPGAPVMAA